MPDWCTVGLRSIPISETLGFSQQQNIVGEAVGESQCNIK